MYTGEDSHYMFLVPLCWNSNIFILLAPSRQFNGDYHKRIVSEYNTKGNFPHSFVHTFEKDERLLCYFWFGLLWIGDALMPGEYWIGKTIQTILVVF